MKLIKENLKKKINPVLIEVRIDGIFIKKYINKYIVRQFLNLVKHYQKFINILLIFGKDYVYGPPMHVSLFVTVNYLIMGGS